MMKSLRYSVGSPPFLPPIRRRCPKLQVAGEARDNEVSRRDVRCERDIVDVAAAEQRVDVGIVRLGAERIDGKNTPSMRPSATRAAICASPPYSFPNSGSCV
jgi:hypothetical protein